MDDLPSTRTISEIIGLIYDCAINPKQWDLALEGIRALFRSQNAQLLMYDLEQRGVKLMKSVGVAPYWLERQLEYASEVADWERLPLAMILPLDEPQVMSRHLPPELRQSSRYLSEWVAPQGLVDSIGLVLMRNPSRHAHMGMGRHVSAGCISDREVELGRLLAPHVRRAVTISNILDVRSIEAEAAKAVFDTLRVGVVLTDSKARILHVNAAAEAMLRAGKPIRSAAGTILTNLTSATAELHAAIELATRNEAEFGKTGLAVRLTNPGHAPVLASVLPIRPGVVRQRLEPLAVAAVFVNPVGNDANGAEAMSIAFDLTRMETRVLTSLLAGRTLVQSAAELGIAFATAKTHLGNIFAKTGVSRQVELVRLAAQIAAPVWCSDALPVRPET
ncbi:DNA-binding CsgD family transcriptional regulator/PAS domain-containing protein [Mesorhizobium soli]|uniref:helix-turn-helix transcriptional regulator n=1 Tax=Pseudaminobacter soli (ex Li et al. 2025) TaxID=1295366 RepID=UPI0024758D00|nr:helix-turn-helix transcriptional regulator [Mesorhizobium soli]MDH6233213.1 DNA-binding CsgD family transcriptional regulator/PAS domain-containing protein [Mesorhizobium soli]